MNSASSPMPRRYTSEPLPERPSPPIQAPRPGHGTVFINTDPDGQVVASWQDDDRFAESDRVGQLALAWASRQPAAEFLIFNEEDDDYVPWTDAPSSQA